MKVNSKNGKEIKLSNVLREIANLMIDEFDSVMDDVVVNVDDIKNDIKLFIQLDRDLYAYNNLGLYQDFENVLRNIKEVLCTYARISAYKVLVREEFNLDKAFVYIIDEKVLEKIDSVLIKMYEGHILTFIPFLYEYILEIFKIYKINFKLDNKFDIVRGYTGENRDGATRKEFVVKRFYLC